MNIADRIQNLRKSKGISQEELADKIGVSRQAVSKWESEQSVPDLDKVIIMSDYFEVTTDYILKGIEQGKQAVENVNAHIFTAVATALNFIGLAIAAGIWYEEQSFMAAVVGLILMAVGCAVFCIGQAVSNQNKQKAKRLFWMINIWMMALIPLSLTYNVLFTGSFAPYPILRSNNFAFVAFVAFWLVYIMGCIGMTLVQLKRKP